jgi:hypothetical protein
MNHRALSNFLSGKIKAYSLPETAVSKNDMICVICGMKRNEKAHQQFREAHSKEAQKRREAGLL